MHYTREQLEALPTPELVKLYNTLTSKDIKRFRTRKVGVDAVLKAVAERTRTVVKSGKSKAGRPQLHFSVAAAESGKSEVRTTSLRGQIIAHLKSITNRTASIVELQEKFGAKTRGAVQKLLEVGWLKRIEPAVGSGG